MPDHLKSDSQTLSARKGWRTYFAAAGLLVLLGIIVVIAFRPFADSSRHPTIVVRIDDIQDFGFREAQLFLLDESMTNDVPLTLAVIAGMFGEDSEIVRAVRLAAGSGSDVAAHGWKHEDMTRLSHQEQAELLSLSKSRIEQTLYLETIILVPPMYTFSEDTIAAMHQEGYSIISTHTDFSAPGPISEVINIPATIELSDYSNGIWTMKSLGSVEAEVSDSVQRYGFAVIVTHPQEFMVDGTLDQTNTASYTTLLRTLKQDYSFGTLTGLADDLPMMQDSRGG